MDVIYRILSIIIAIIVFIVIIIIWGWYGESYNLIEWWNRRIKSECDEQDKHSINGIPSYYNAWDCPNKTAIEFHRLIKLNHDDILEEVMEVIKNKEEGGNMEDDENELFKEEKKWNPIWVRIMGEWSNESDKLPTLKRIISLFPEIPIVHISVFYPGITVVESKNKSRAFHKYHYGLRIPYGDVGLKISGFDVKWKEKEGFIWDDTLIHSAWNHTCEPRIVIFADIFRELSGINSIGSKAVYTILKQNTIKKEKKRIIF